MAAVDRFRVVGGARLVGEVTVSGAKNSVLKLMAASLLAAGKTTIRNVPDIADVEISEKDANHPRLADTSGVIFI